MVNRIKRIMNNNIMFFVNNAYNKEYNVFHSEIDNEGQVVSDKVHIIALSSWFMDY